MSDTTPANVAVSATRPDVLALRSLSIWLNAKSDKRYLRLKAERCSLRHSHVVIAKRLNIDYALI